MSDEKEIVLHEGTLGGIATGTMNVVTKASEVSTVLAKVIKDQNLFIEIKNKQYVTVEGWNALGAMLGVLPRERETKKFFNEDGSYGYEAYIELIRSSDGAVIGGASSICTNQESRWKGRDEYAIRSMAITRATGKAFRVGFSWIMQLAGYSVTPAEEIIDAELFDVKEPKSPLKKSLNVFEPDELREKLAARIAKIKSEIADGSKKYTANETDRKVLASALTKLFGKDEIRYAATKWLVGHESTKDMDVATVVALLKWMRVSDFNSTIGNEAIIEGDKVARLVFDKSGVVPTTEENIPY